ncbi:LacI family DNA-binding transcriptional regulator [Myceligenerans pegani]|uniref:LacI family DNA-binding transcriptional regulator n=1 Tax=Myceligenerans pegani TaxID=2776917 RepID=A0ABR9N5U3_9MICO|nr:LacI family DNA-binding transcriptional regulator [Myceligenerans sp. TRM 65318]MBE1879029.1 LacI family DNA-binding transcriptional regulator [Myceligenerans sp. TRM 65318]MBE3021300.1 LacI family DNA-binding transcriptional regulator [Myceligenerans sp. TRM 65318]
MTTQKRYRAPVLADVAREAQVSVPTVSRVLNGTKYVAPELAQRVHRAIETLGYRPNQAARSVRSGRRTLVSVLSGATANYGYARTLQGIETAARRAGMSVTITVVESDDDDDLKRAVDLALAQPTAGAIVLEFDRAGIDAGHLLPEGLPVVVAGGGTRRTRNATAALIDERTAARRATDYLLRLGHRTVHHVAGPTAGKHSGRTDGWRAALTAAGAEVPTVMNAEWDAASGYRWGERIAGRDDVTAVLCGNDEIAIGLMRALSDRGLDVPGDISVVGFDDQPLVALWRPSLTTVDQDFEDLGERAFSLLERLMTDEEGDGAGTAGTTGQAARTSVVVPQLVVRESTAPPSA